MENKSVKTAYYLAFAFILSCVAACAIVIIMAINNILIGRLSDVVVWILIFSFFIPIILFIFAAVFTFVKSKKIKDGCMHEHFQWLKNTFIIFIVAIFGSYIFGYLFYFFLVNLFIVPICLYAIRIFFCIWFLYRIVIGYIKFIKGKSHINFT